MKTNKTTAPLVLVLLSLSCLFSLGTVGCKPSGGGAVGKEEQNNWKGGPMPKDFKPNVAGGGGAPSGK